MTPTTVIRGLLTGVQAVVAHDMRNPQAIILDKRAPGQKRRVF
jgi:hypothetical protein